MSVARRSPSALMQISPGMTHPPSRLCLSDLRCSVLCKCRALTILAASPRYNASYPLPVRQASALPSASSRFAVTHDTLAVQLTLPLVGRVEDFHLQVNAPCRAHGRVENRLSPALPHQTVHALLTHTAFRCSSRQGMYFLRPMFSVATEDVAPAYSTSSTCQ